MKQEATALKEHPIDKASRFFQGGRCGLSRALTVTTAAIGNWKLRNSIPVKYCALIEAATNGAVTRKDLRPDDWHLTWPELATTQPTAQGQGEA